MKFILAFVSLFSISAFSADYQMNEFKFTISDRANDGSFIYYNCDSVEPQVKWILKKMGAQRVRVVCRGGLDRFGGGVHLPARVSVRFEALNIEVASSRKVGYETVKFRRSGGCHFLNSVVKAVAPSFEIKSLDMRRCYNSRSAGKVEMEVLKEID